jgi:3-methylcrotonyl-CoA carboxylase alpha subunit/geranyl-CoA carboxylase alpha subunit
MRHRGDSIALRVQEHGDGTLAVEDGSGSGVQVLRPSAAVAVALQPGRWHVQSGAVDLFIEDASFGAADGDARSGSAAELRAPFNGKVIAVKVAPGSAVARGDTLLVIESMKLEHALAAARDGVVKAVHVEPGQQAATAQVLVSFEAQA